jgi:hypothetical protein
MTALIYFGLICFRTIMPELTLFHSQKVYMPALRAADRFEFGPISNRLTTAKPPLRVCNFHYERGLGSPRAQAHA